jgi:hypothetical protein
MSDDDKWMVVGLTLVTVIMVVTIGVCFWWVSNQ